MWWPLYYSGDLLAVFIPIQRDVTSLDTSIWSTLKAAKTLSTVRSRSHYCLCGIIIIGSSGLVRIGQLQSQNSTPTYVTLPEGSNSHRHRGFESQSLRAKHRSRNRSTVCAEDAEGQQSLSSCLEYPWPYWPFTLSIDHSISFIKLQTNTRPSNCYPSQEPLTAPMSSYPGPTARRVVMISRQGLGVVGNDKKPLPVLLSETRSRLLRFTLEAAPLLTA
ncbi:hypothetical protein VTK56DRAFT_9651 [Thermocarpiscus australiensis]